MATNPPPRKLKKGELLFNEGDQSKSMYFVQTGQLRLFKKKGASSIELGIIHKGEVIGEMGFLDGGPRSASAEAMHDTDLVEITNSNLAEQLKVLPAWLIVLLKTVVNRLRSANNKIRQLESASVAYTYGSEGVSTTYQFLSTHEILKVASALLLVGARNSESGPNGSYKISQARLLRYANQIMGVSETKVDALLDVLERVGLAKVDRAILDKVDIYIMDLDALETMVAFINEENMKEHSKKINLSIKSVIMMGFIVRHLGSFPPNKEGMSEVNMAKIMEAEKADNNGKEPFRMDDITDLVKYKLCTELAIKDSNTINTTVNARYFSKLYSIQKTMKEIEVINETKREQAARGSR